MKTKLKLFHARLVCAVVLGIGSSSTLVTAADSTFTDANWSSMGGVPGANGGVAAMVVDGAGNLYIGGSFTIVGDVIAHGLAKWDGSKWSALGLGKDSDVSALAVSGSDLYVGGYFTTAGGVPTTQIAKWNGSSWSGLGSVTGGIRLFVSALAVSGGDLYAAGYFGTVGGTPAAHIAKWNGSSWSALGSGIESLSRGGVYALAVSGGDLYAGGKFETAGGVAANYIAKWDGSNWSALGEGVGTTDGAAPRVSALTVSGGDLYAGGTFTTAGGIASANIAKWDGSSWSALSSGLDGAPSGFVPLVSALAVSGGDLYAGGYITMAGGSAANGIAKWNGSIWSALGSGVNGNVSALTVSGGKIYVTSGFTTPQGIYSTSIAQWNGSRWSELGALRLGMNGAVSALTDSGSDLYAGGDFTAAGGVAATNIAKWNGSGWSALGSGVGDAPSGFGGTVSALAVSGSDLYAGGYFTTAGGGLANCIAKWNGNSWSALAAGVGSDSINPNVSALAVSGSNVYAAGYFTTAGGSAANNIAKWNGSRWSALGSGMNTSVYALAVSGNDLYAGGHFTMAGGRAANYIAKWDGSSWSALGTGMNDSVRALAVSGSYVYAGGFFTTAGGVAANHIAKWDGTSWSALGEGIRFGSTVYALAVSGDDVYAGGAFATAGGSTANHIAKWDGSSWSALGSGMGSSVPALAVSGSDLYAGGSFTTAGGKVSVYIARAYLSDLPALSVRRFGADVEVSWPLANTSDFALEQSATLAPASWAPNTAVVTDDGAKKSVTLPLTSSSRFFRLRRP